MPGGELVWLLLPIAAASGWYVARRSARNDPRSAGQSGLHSDYFKGINYLLNEQPDKAIEVFIRVLEVDSETVETHLALGNLYRRRGEVDRAIRIHQNLIERPALEPGQRSEAMLELGQDYLSAGLLDRAENIFQELADAGTYRVQALRQLIDIFEQEKDWEGAVASAQRLQEATGNQLGAVIAQYHCEQAEQAKNEGDHQRVMDEIAAALRTHKGCVRASLLEGDLCVSMGDHAAAIAAYQRVERQSPDYVPTTVKRIHECFMALGRPDEMKQYLSALMDRYGWITATLALADMTEEQRGVPEAITFMAEQLRRRASVRGLDRLLQLELQQADEASSQHLIILKDLTSKLLADRPVYKCLHCGFPAKSLHWQCPSCKHWGSVKPIQGVEGE
jgi:lipopolysaccharide biosynthesis regulator YciM